MSAFSHYEASAPSKADAGAALDRLIAIAREDHGGSRRVADFLLAWWDGSLWGHFPITHIASLDPWTVDDMVMIITYLSRNGCWYADHWDRRDAMADLVEQWRDTTG